MEHRDFLQQCLDEEQRYTFPSFDRHKVWELGCDLVEACREAPGPLAAEIYLNGTLVFRYYPAGTGAFHEKWLRRKYNTVTVMERSSMRLKAELQCSGSTLEAEGLSETEYAACGGGFPIRLTGGAVIGCIGVSGLPDVQDHAALLSGLHRFFLRNGFLQE